MSCLQIPRGTRGLLKASPLKQLAPGNAASHCNRLDTSAPKLVAAGRQWERDACPEDLSVLTAARDFFLKSKQASEFTSFPSGGLRHPPGPGCSKLSHT